MSCRGEAAEARRGRRRPQHSSGLNNLPTSRWVSRRPRYRGRGKRGGGLEADAEPKMGKNQPSETQRMYYVVCVNENGTSRRSGTKLLS